MKPLKTIPFTFRTLLLGASLLFLISCNEEAADQVQKETGSSAKAEASNSAQKEVTDTTKGIAYFEAGLKAAEANNMPLAFKEFLAGAKEGHAYAQYNVALMYERGFGIDKNEKEAVHWYNKCALQGNSDAQFNLGVCYENGIGTAIDFDKANAWYRKASVQGDGLAIGNLGMLYIRGQGVQENKVAGVALLMMSAAMDNSPENQARNNITATPGLTAAIVTEAQALSAEMSNSENLLVPLDNYLNATK